MPSRIQSTLRTGTLATAMLLAMPAAAQLAPVPDDNTTLAADPLQGQGRLVFLNDTAETGTIFDTEIGKAEFTFRNTGGGPLIITQVKPSCGCTVPELEKTVYEAGEMGTISVDFDPKGKRGNLARSITIFTDSVTTPSVAITVRSHVKPVVITEPAGVLVFEQVEKGATATKSFRVLGRFEEFKVTRATTVEPEIFDINIRSGETVEIEGETLYEHFVDVTLIEGARPGQHRGEITIRTNDERRPIFTVSAAARVLGDLQLNPVRMTLGRLTVGEEFTREIRIASRSGSAFEITNATLGNDAVEVQVTAYPIDEEARSEWLLRLSGTVVNAAPRFNAVMNLMTDVKDEEITTVQLYGQLRPQ